MHMYDKRKPKKQREQISMFFIFMSTKRRKDHQVREMKTREWKRLLIIRCAYKPIYKHTQRWTTVAWALFIYWWDLAIACFFPFCFLSVSFTFVDVIFFDCFRCGGSEENKNERKKNISLEILNEPKAKVDRN